MNEFLTPPIFLTAVSIGAFCVGIIVGLLCARAGRKSQLDASFEQGISEGQKKAEEASKVEQEELAVSLAEQFKDMRDGIVQTVQAYQKAVDTCGDKLTLPESELLALSASPVSADIEAEAVEIEDVSTEEPVESEQTSCEEQRDESDIEVEEESVEVSPSTRDVDLELTESAAKAPEASETESVVASEEKSAEEGEEELAVSEGGKAKEDSAPEALAKDAERVTRVIH